MVTEKAKMEAGAWYSCHGPELLRMQAAARAALHRHNSLPPEARGGIAPDLAALMAAVGRDVLIETPFHCAYAVNLHLGDGVYMNAGCTILDTAPVRIGAGTMLGPQVQIYCPDHHRDPAGRRAGLERARPVTIGGNVWIGGGAILLPGGNCRGGRDRRRGQCRHPRCAGRCNRRRQPGTAAGAVRCVRPCGRSQGLPCLIARRGGRARRSHRGRG